MRDVLVSTCAGGDEDKDGDKGGKPGKDDKTGTCTHTCNIAYYRCRVMQVM